MALVKFPLIMADGFKANTLEQLKEHFDIKSVVGYFYDRRLIRWLKINGCAEELSAVEKLSKLDRDLGRKLGAIFGFEIDGSEDDDPKIPVIMNRLKQLTADKKLLAQVEKDLRDGSAIVVRTQKEFDAEAQYCDRIYLAGNQFVIPLDETDKTYIGIGESARAVIKSDKIVDFDALNITFEKIRFDDDYQKLIEQSPEKKSEDAEKLYEEAEQAAYAENDWSTALEKYKQAAELDYPKAFVSVGNIYYFGEGDIEQDINEARRWYKRGMDKNDADSFGWYALSLNSDDASEDDKREAFRCMKRATELAPEDGSWWNKLGDMYRYGTGTEKNLAKTVECYEKALQAGNSDAANKLGVLYSRGEYIEQNPRKAFDLFKQAVELDDFNINDAAMKNLAYCYRDGDGTEKNPALAFKYFKQAAEAGNVDAMLWTGICYYNGEGTSEDFTQAFKWFKQAAEAGNPDGMSNLSLCYLWGNGIRKNLNLAEYWMKKAAEAGEYYGMLQYANWLTSEDKRDRRLVAMYEQVANAGYGEAAYKLAMIYLNGWGVAQSNNNYEYWLHKSQELGYEPE